MAKRTGKIVRKTKETAIALEVRLEVAGSSVRTPVPFLSHMLLLLSAHGGFGLIVNAKGDTEVDDHHLVEDMGICLGQAFAKALGEKRGIRRYGEAVVPMDEALAQAAVDISGRAYLSYGLKPGARKIKNFDLALVKEFLLGFVRHVPCTLHIRQLAGGNAHHVVEAGFKALGKALGQAVGRGANSGVPSTKGRL